MEWKIEGIREGTDIDQNGRFYRFKVVSFTVDGGRHTIRVSMPDFNADKTKSIVEAEVVKISSVFSGTGSGRKKEGV